MKRRSFLKTSAATAVTAPFIVGGLQARASSSLNMMAQLPADDNDRILIVIQLFGGNDGLNTVIPLGNQNSADEYYRIRPNIRVREDQVWNELGDIYLHPALSNQDTKYHGGMAEMLQSGTLAIVQRIGYDNPNLSHFRSTDIWLSGINSSDPNTRLDTGWIGRYLERKYPDFPASLPDHPLAVQFSGFSLMLLASEGKKMGIEVTDPDLQQGVNSQLDELDDKSPGTAYLNEYQYIADIAGRSNKYAQAVQDAYTAGKGQLQGNYDASNNLANQMRSVAALIAGGLKTKVYIVSIGGFDTHVTQQRDDGEFLSGTHPYLLARISNAVSEFMYDMIRLNQADRVVGMTVSEFGRRPQENGSFGTDHGAASVQFVFGTQVNSGVFGNTPDLTNLNANGDLIYEIDYRQTYLEVLSDWFGLTLAEAREVLQTDSLDPVDVLQAQTTDTPYNGKGTAAAAIVGNYPNPFTGSTTFEVWVERPVHVLLELSTLTGQPVATLVNRTLEAGRHRFPFSGQLASGVYLCVMRAGGRTFTHTVRCVR